MKSPHFTIWLLGLLFLAGGCARYEYDIVQPANLAQHIDDHEHSLDWSPLVYHLQAYEDRLVMRIENSASDPVQLLGRESFVVDPKGQSHPLPTQSIAPGSYIKLIFPPMRPRVPNGPTIGFGIGTRISRAVVAGTSPVYLQDLADPEMFFWDWEGQTDVRIRLVYQQNQQTFPHEFFIHRRKM